MRQESDRLSGLPCDLLSNARIAVKTRDALKKLGQWLGTRVRPLLHFPVHQDL